jgi:hypothetical protein
MKKKTGEVHLRFFREGMVYSPFALLAFTHMNFISISECSIRYSQEPERSAMPYQILLG